MKIKLIGLVIIFNSYCTFAITIPVSTIVALQSAINNASSGDSIILADGTYLNNVLTIGTGKITIIPATPGGVFLNGTNDIKITGDSATFSGFQFTSGTITANVIEVSGNYNTLTQLNFNGYSANHMIVISGQYNFVTYCNFQNKPAINLINHGGTGDMLQIIPDSTKIGYNTIRYCSFQHMPGFGGDYGNECIRIGDGAFSTYLSRTVVEYCYFEDTGNGDSEAISIKSRENCLRYNTMNDNPNAMFAFRNGNDNVAYSNFFIRSGGIRCKEANNIFCYNNYFERSGINQNASLPGSGTSPIFLEYFGVGFGNNFNLIHNTFYRCINSKFDTGLTNCTWANNIFLSDSATIFSGISSGQNFAGNIYQGSLGLSISSGFLNIDPLLVINLNGYYGLSSSSPAIAASNPNYPVILNLSGLNNDPNIMFDIEGQARPSALTLKDVGCDQFQNGPISNHPLSLCDVGPMYLCSSPVSIDSIKEDEYNSVIYPNPNNGVFFLRPETQISKLRISNLKGEIIFSSSNIEQSPFNRIDLSDFPKGIYFLEIRDEEKYISYTKIIVQ